MFFVLSGFFITGLLIRERTKTHKLSFRAFYTRRVKRILPSALLVLVVTVIGAYLLFPATRARTTLVDALYAALFGANFRFEAVGADYFQQGQPPSPIQHYWSLSIEEQFYFVWPMLLVGLFAVTRRHRKRGNTWVRQWGLFAGMALIVASSFGWAFHLSVADPNAAYFSTFTRVWELGVGALLAIASPWLARIPTIIRPVLAYLGLLGVAASLFVIDSATRWPAPWAALPVLSTALVVASFHDAPLRGMRILDNPVARWLGDTSYTLYLWHWPVIILLLAVVPRGPVFYGVAVGIALILTAVTYQFYEDPIRKSGWLLDREKSSRRMLWMPASVWAGIGAFTAAVAVIAILAIGHFSAVEQVARQSQQSEANSTPMVATQKKLQSDPCFGARAMMTPGCVLHVSGTPLQPSIDDFAQDTADVLSNCYRQKGQARLQPCVYGYEGPDATRIALVGDSHAASLIPGLWPILGPNKWQLTTYVGNSCQLADSQGTGCEEQMEQVKADLVAHPYSLVLVTNFNQSLSPQSYEKAWEPIAAAGSRIAVVVDNPRTSEEALACLTRVLGEDHAGDCGTPRAQALPKPDPLIATAQLVPGTSVIDLTPYYCTADRCPSVIGNVIVYRDLNVDNSHITATYMSTLSGVIEDGIRRALGKPPHP